jgi:hypothetical protein
MGGTWECRMQKNEKREKIYQAIEELIENETVMHSLLNKIF